MKFHQLDVTKCLFLCSCVLVLNIIKLPQILKWEREHKEIPKKAAFAFNMCTLIFLSWFPRECNNYSHRMYIVLGFVGNLGVI